MLSSTVPETDIIFKKLESEERLKKYKIKEIYEMSPLNSQLNLKIAEYISIIGKYDIDTQLKCTDEFTGYFLNLKEQYTEYYNSHCRLYIAISLSLGMSVVVLFV